MSGLIRAGTPRNAGRNPAVYGAAGANNAGCIADFSGGDFLFRLFERGGGWGKRTAYVKMLGNYKNY